MPKFQVDKMIGLLVVFENADTAGSRVAEAVANFINDRLDCAMQ
jgi:hypothetical protein